jgi:hypothetical protein
VAILHAFGLFVMVRYSLTDFGVRLWLGFATLWLLWLVVLPLHPAASLLRVVLPVVVALPILWPSVRQYSRIGGIYFFGLTPGVSLSPTQLIDYFTAKRKGRLEAENELRSGVLAVETAGLPMPNGTIKAIRDRYNIELRYIASDTDVTAKVLGHINGYNEVSQPEIRRRFGTDVVRKTEDEFLRRWRQSAN